MPQANSIAKGHRLQATNFYVTINSNRRVVLADQLMPEERPTLKKLTQHERLILIKALMSG